MKTIVTALCLMTLALNAFAGDKSVKLKAKFRSEGQCKSRGKDVRDLLVEHGVPGSSSSVTFRCKSKYKSNFFGKLGAVVADAVTAPLCIVDYMSESGDEDACMPYTAEDGEYSHTELQLKAMAYTPEKSGLIAERTWEKALPSYCMGLKSSFAQLKGNLKFVTTCLGGKDSGVNVKVYVK